MENVRKIRKALRVKYTSLTNSLYKVTKEVDDYLQLMEEIGGKKKE